MNDHARRTVERGYDRVAERYLATKDDEDPVALAALEDLARRLPAGAAVLDLGCGAGVPATRWLTERFAVTGVDLSERQLKLARRHAPAATLIKADMTGVRFGSETFDAVVSLHAVIHVPRDEHPALLNAVRRWLKPGGLFLATWAVGAWEGEESDWEGWGAPRWWSHHDREASLEMLRDAGFGIEAAQERTSSGARGDQT